MKFIPQKRYKKRFLKLPIKLQEKCNTTLKIFEANPFDVRLHNHVLLGEMKEKRAIAVTTDIRIIFCEYFNYEIILLLDVGTHNQVY